MAMLKQLLVNLITVLVAVGLLTVAAKFLYYELSPYESCMRTDAWGHKKFEEVYAKAEIAVGCMKITHW